ncbi:AAA family ATPase [Paenibacillus sp. D2_2]|uniref:AAA family ATPase n=1 Tax=Paenibacillus sp. D2_2 TaxID=3073092 RepID=UPI002815565D|nr:AAA family ATPase [Paenibacillus sp. D2_2]WMT41744.1 AAA family ATPase [Paenibacillus sp. D2_2]
MNNYYISRIYLENFKAIDKAMINFEGRNLNVLDGPNGFGKTTIFDAIELVLTGAIRRINSNKIASTNRGYSDHLLSKNQNKITVIKLEFNSIVEPSSRIILARALYPSNLSSLQKRPGDFGSYKLYILDDIDEQISEEKLVESNKLNELFNLNKIEDNFMLYHYVEQEESGHFFKQNEKDRMSAISKLFNIENEISQKNFMERTRNKLVRRKNDIDRTVKKEEAQDNEKGKEQQPEVPYLPLIAEEGIRINWDQNDLPDLSKEMKEEYLTELDNLKLLVENYSDFKIEQKNKELDNVSNSTERLKALIICSHFSDKLNELENRYKEQKELINILEIIKGREIIDKEVNWNIVSDTVEGFQANEITTKLSHLKKVHNSTNNMSKIIDQMNSSRERLSNLFKDYLKNNETKDNYCPLCGSKKETYEELISDIELKTADLKSELDGAAKQVSNELDTIYLNYLNDAVQKVEIKLQSSTVIKEEFLEQLRSLSNVIPDYNKAVEWFSQNQIDLNPYINQEEKFVHDLDERVSNLRRDILEKKQPVSDQCRDNMKILLRLYTDRFSKKDHVLQGISLTNIDNKKSYIEYQYYLQMNKAYMKIIKLKNESARLDIIISSITRILVLYNNKINTYRGKMISDIEIPFYIYSGKIIQTHQRGIGVFIKEEREGQSTDENQLKAINFVPPEKTDHDIVHSFSSGQLASTVIAFTLALHKVYSKKGISTLLIDDPVQTMDEMNMVSLVELLRNDFHDRQIILSTHEEKVSLYLRYKFFKYGYSVGNVNVKDELYSTK